MSMSALISVVDRRKLAFSVSSAILFRVLLFVCFIIEKALSQMYMLMNLDHIFYAKSLKWGNCSLFVSSQNASYRSFFLDKRKESFCNSYNLPVADTFCSPMKWRNFEQFFRSSKVFVNG